MSLLETQNIDKSFPGVHALKDVSISFDAGSIHALLGENGAGKSTLGKILAGLITPDSGQVVLSGKPVSFSSPAAAVAAGIGMVHQELLFAENLTVAENLCLSDLPRKGIFVDRAAMRSKARRWLEPIAPDIHPNQRLGELPISKQQLVQIAGGIGKGARVLIFDEPTSSLTQSEADRLLALIRQLKRDGMCCIYVSHRLEEIFAICDRVSVLRDGALVGTVPIEGIDRNELVRMMIGRDLAASLADHTTAQIGQVVLEVSDLASPGRIHNISLTVSQGEIVGLAGLVGAGRTEVAEALFGLDRAARGESKMNGSRYRRSGPREAMARRIGLVPEDRKRHGLVLSLSAGKNVTLPTIDRLSVGGFVRRDREKKLVSSYFESLRIKAPGLEASTIGLSGGNQQKLVLAKWLASDADLLIVDEPTRGVDVGAKAEIHQVIRTLAAQGKAILLISSELPELLSLSTRILVMREGTIVGKLPGGCTEEEVMRLMAGVDADRTPSG